MLPYEHLIILWPNDHPIDWVPTTMRITTGRAGARPAAIASVRRVRHLLPSGMLPDRVRGLLPRAPRWLEVLVGAACAGLGGLLITRPLSALSVLATLIGLSFIVSGIGDLLARDRSPATRLGALTALAWVVFGVVVLVWLGRAIELLAPAVAIALIAGGFLRLGVVRSDGEGRFATVLFGLADIVFGAVALGWPDVTLLVVAIVFGARMLFFGLARIWAGLVRSRAGRVPAGHDGTHRRRAGAVRFVGSVAALVLAIGLALLGSQLRAGSPLVDAFYYPSGEVPDTPGQLLDSEPFTRGIPETARAWRILYTTTRNNAAPTVGSALVVVPRDTTGAPPVITWTHGTTGYDRACAPTLLAEPLASGAMFVEDQVVSEGWALVATDYMGLGTEGPHPYLIGEGQARSALDALLAARQMEAVALGDETVVWGHSQGGHAALWTGILAPSYAPDINVLGIAALAPAADLPGFLEALPEITGGSVFASFVIQAYSEIYDDVEFDAYVDPAGRTIAREMSKRCLSEPGVAVSVLHALALSRDRQIFRTDTPTGALRERLIDNVPVGDLPAPVLIGQGLSDTIIDPDVQDAYAAARCAERWNLDYRRYPDRDHLSLVAPDSELVPELIQWTHDRLDGVDQEPDCSEP